ncbi:MAG TPA: hypothetical protein PL124_11880 [Candidatus Cloacimonadota bacterium]|nr:hypothetical protein [Candidatus Cloacimonadota bacterium]
MRLKAKSKVIALIAIMLMSAWLYSSTIRIDVTNVYYNQGNITVTILDQGSMGLSYTRTFAPTVYCCGTQTIYWEDFPLSYPARIYVEAEQSGRSANQSGITIEPWPSTTFVYLTLPIIPNFPHKNERK